MNFSYHNKQGHQAGFYVVASDKDLLAKVTGLLKRRGYLGVVDTSGKVNYLIDGRKNTYQAAHRITELATVLEDNINSYTHSDETVYQIIEELLTEFAIPKNLKGYHYLKNILWLLSAEPLKLKPASKYVYPETAKRFGVSENQIDRVIRYATRCAGIRMSNGRLLVLLNERLQKRLQEEQRKDPKLQVGTAMTIPS